MQRIDEHFLLREAYRKTAATERRAKLRCLARNGGEHPRRRPDRTPTALVSWLAPRATADRVDATGSRRGSRCLETGARGARRPPERMRP